MTDSISEYTKLCSNDIENKSVAVDVDYNCCIEKHKTANKGKGRKWSSCLKWCLYVVLTLLCMSIIAGVAAYMAISDIVHRYATETPYGGVIPVIDIAQTKLEIFLDESKLFMDLIIDDQVPDDFVLPVDIMNGFIANSDYLRGNMYAQISQDKISVIHALPMDMFPGGRSRYLVGKTTIFWNAESSELQMTMKPLDETDGNDYIDFRGKVDFHGDGDIILKVLTAQFLDWSLDKYIAEQSFSSSEVMKSLCENKNHHHHGHYKLCKNIPKAIAGIKSMSSVKDQIIVSAHSHRVD